MGLQEDVKILGTVSRESRLSVWIGMKLAGGVYAGRSRIMAWPPFILALRERLYTPILPCDESAHHGSAAQAFRPMDWCSCRFGQTTSEARCSSTALSEPCCRKEGRKSHLIPACWPPGRIARDGVSPLRNTRQSSSGGWLKQWPAKRPGCVTHNLPATGSSLVGAILATVRVRGLCCSSERTLKPAQYRFAIANPLGWVPARPNKEGQRAFGPLTAELYAWSGTSTLKPFPTRALEPDRAEGRKAAS
jgi:hypothetical protein